MIFWAATRAHFRTYLFRARFPRRPTWRKVTEIGRIGLCNPRPRRIAQVAAAALNAAIHRTKQARRKPTFIHLDPGELE